MNSVTRMDPQDSSFAEFKRLLAELQRLFLQEPQVASRGTFGGQEARRS
jgi:hypothetical protein